MLKFMGVHEARHGVERVAFGIGALGHERNILIENAGQGGGNIHGGIHLAYPCDELGGGARIIGIMCYHAGATGKVGKAARFAGARAREYFGEDFVHVPEAAAVGVFHHGQTACRT